MVIACMTLFVLYSIVYVQAFSRHFHFSKNQLRLLHDDRKSWHRRFTKIGATTSDAATIESDTSLRDLYPPSTPKRNGTLQVDDTHKIFYEIYGKDDDASRDEEFPTLYALFLHGGPGAGCFPNHARFFDPARYQIILLDQRGSGRSTPMAGVKNNTLMHLVEDCEKVRSEIGIKRWDTVLGGSWGSTLAIAYAQSYPESVKSMVLRGVCLLRTSEVDWLFSSKGIALKINETAWKQFEQGAKSTTKKSEEKNRRSVLHGHYDLFLGSNDTKRVQAARSWMGWESTVSASSLQMAADQDAGNQNNLVLVSKSNEEEEEKWQYQNSEGKKISSEDDEDTMMGSPQGMEAPGKFVLGMIQGLHSLDDDITFHESDNILSPSRDEESSTRSRPYKLNGEITLSNQTMANRFLAQALLTCFYSVNNIYAMNNIHLLENERMKKIQNIPCIAVQGGLDQICPVDTALDLKESWPSLELRIPLLAGHSMYHPAIKNELIRATDRIAMESENPHSSFFAN